MNDERAFCGNCGWEGLRSELKDVTALDGNCPACGSDNTWWGQPDPFYDEDELGPADLGAC